MIAPLLDIWKATKPFQPFPNYGAGTWGPATSDALLARDGRAWHNVVNSPATMPQPKVHVEGAGEPIAAKRASVESDSNAKRVTVKARK